MKWNINRGKFTFLHVIETQIVLFTYTQNFNIIIRSKKKIIDHFFSDWLYNIKNYEIKVDLFTIT